METTTPATRAPWFAAIDSDCDNFAILDCPPIATEHGLVMPIGAQQLAIVRSLGAGREARQQQQANAKLMADAPELLDLIRRAYALAEDLEPNELEAGALLGDMQDALQRHGIDPDALVIPADPAAQPLRIEPAQQQQPPRG